MWPVSSRYLDAIRNGGYGVTASVVHRNLVTGAQTALDVEDGSVTVDTTSNVRRTLNLTLPNEQATWDLLDTPGGEITVTSTIVYADHSTEDVPLGVFVVDADQIGVSLTGQISITAPDRFLMLQRTMLAPGSRASVSTNTQWQEIKRLVEGAWPNSSYPFPGWAQLDTSATDAVGILLWDDGSRETALMDATSGLVPMNGLQLFFDANGLAVLRPAPVLTSSSPYVWTVDAGASGVMIDASRSRDRSGFKNVIYASTNASDVTFIPVTVANTGLLDPLSTHGPLTWAEEWQGPFRNSAQATTGANARLAKRRGNAQQVALTLAPNRALDGDDVVLVVYPTLDRNLAPPNELHILDQVVIPLKQDGQQTLQTRSTQAGL